MLARRAEIRLPIGGRAWYVFSGRGAGVALPPPNCNGDHTMNSAHKWIIVLAAYDDPAIEPRVIKERIPIEDDEQLAAFLRGGQLVAVLGLDQEAAAEAQRIDVERTCLR